MLMCGYSFQPWNHPFVQFKGHFSEKIRLGQQYPRETDVVPGIHRLSIWS